MCQKVKYCKGNADQMNFYATDSNSTKIPARASVATFNF